MKNKVRIINRCYSTGLEVFIIQKLVPISQNLEEWQDTYWFFANLENAKEKAITIEKEEDYWEFTPADNIVNT